MKFDLIKNKPSYLSLESSKLGSPLGTVFAVSLLFIFYTLQNYFFYLDKGEFMGGYPLSVSLLFAPIYEEIIFRGVVYGQLERLFNWKKAAIITCLLFGIWHLKNIFYLDLWFLLYQIIYAAVIFGPVLIFVLRKTNSIWLGVVVHYVNNIIAPYSWAILERLGAYV